ncbi:hypothetical protein [Humidisolicoccus flavus]|uniref:hypothetical protein n=1 Tax=Humidisolicoccus flavus TaxID=3111414 RepID=UPI0032502B72
MSGLIRVTVEPIPFEFLIDLCEHYFSRYGSGDAESCSPLNRDESLLLENSGSGDGFSLRREDESIEFRSLESLLFDLFERDYELFTSGYVTVETTRFMDVLRVDHYRHIHRHISAVIHEFEGSFLPAPLNDPTYVPCLKTLVLFLPLERVRFMAEFVRLLGNGVRVHGLGQRSLARCVRVLGMLVRSLRVSVSEEREPGGGGSHDGCYSRCYSRYPVRGIHGEIISGTS